MTESTLKLGILGTGNMARQFAQAAKDVDDVELHAVASRSEGNAIAFAEAHGVTVWHADYGALVQDADIDIVYVSTPHARHRDDCMLCLEADKAVICEKPFAINARESEEVVVVARQRDLFLMEALWSRFLPSYEKLRQLLADNVIGDVNMMIAGGAFIPGFPPEHYLLRRELGGGVMLDAGIYLVSLASMVFGTPTGVRASGTIGAEGVDDQDAVLLQHDSGATAILYVSMKSRRAPDVEILGSRGRIHLHAPIFSPVQLSVQVFGEDPEEITLPFNGNGYQYQLAAAIECIRNGEQESSVMPLDETLAIMRTMDAIREQVGMVYAADSK